MLLGIESAFDSASAAIGTINKILDSVTIADKRNAGKLLIPSIKNLFDKNNISIEQIEGIFVDLGPGSFTGVRIAGIIVKVIFSAVKKKYFGLSSLEIMVYNFLQEFDKWNGILIPFIEAKSNFIYTSIFSLEGSNVKEIKSPFIISFDKFLKTIKEYSNYHIISCEQRLVDSIKNSAIESLKFIDQPTA
ncbi:MAG: tRNA (adenosine(37)-N6)-threonylcarbamoyltransferase complex dimerization subunit type 1 TsaB, partial [Planctomycetota bacterium]